MSDHKNFFEKFEFKDFEVLKPFKLGNAFNYKLKDGWKITHVTMHLPESKRHHITPRYIIYDEQGNRYKHGTKLPFKKFEDLSCVNFDSSYGNYGQTFVRTIGTPTYSFTLNKGNKNITVKITKEVKFGVWDGLTEPDVYKKALFALFKKTPELYAKNTKYIHDVIFRGPAQDKAINDYEKHFELQQSHKNMSKEDAKKRFFDAAAKNEALQAKLEELTKQLAQSKRLKAQNQTLQTQNQTLQTQNQTLQTQNQTLQTQNQTLQTQNQTLQTRSEEFTTIKSKNEQLVQEMKNLRLANTEQALLKSKHKLRKDLSAGNEQLSLKVTEVNKENYSYMTRISDIDEKGILKSIKGKSQYSSPSIPSYLREDPERQDELSRTAQSYDLFASKINSDVTRFDNAMSRLYAETISFSSYKLDFNRFQSPNTIHYINSDDLKERFFIDPVFFPENMNSIYIMDCTGNTISLGNTSEIIKPDQKPVEAFTWHKIPISELSKYKITSGTLQYPKANAENEWTRSSMGSSHTNRYLIAPGFANDKMGTPAVWDGQFK